MDEVEEYYHGSCLGSFVCLQEFLAWRWVEMFEKQRFSSEEKRRQMFKEQRKR